MKATGTIRTVITFLVIGANILAGTVMATDWPMFCQNGHHTGDTSSSAPEHPKVLWQKQLNNDGFYSTPSIADGMLFLGGRDRKMYALDAETGETAWTYSTTPQQNGEGIANTAAVTGGKVYFGSDDFFFYCVDQATGQLVWSYNIAETGVNPQTYGLQASPLVANGVVYAGADMSQGDNLNLVDNLVALDAGSGEVMWTFDTNGRVYSSPALDGNRMFVGTFSGDFYVIDISTGGPRREPTAVWTKHYDHGLMGSAMIFEDRVYIGEGQYQESSGTYYLHAYNLNGNDIWKYKVGWPILSTPIPNEGRIYFADYGGTVHAVKMQGNPDGTTDTVWSRHISDENIWGTTLLADGKLYITSANGRIYCLDPDGNGDGTTFELWNMTLDGEIWSSPVAVDDKLYVATLNGTLYCIVEDIDAPELREPEVETAYADPLEATAGKDVTIKVAFKKEGDLSLVKEVDVDLTALGGLPNTKLVDDGTNGDQTANDGMYSYRHTLLDSTPEGYYELPVTVVLVNGKKFTASVQGHIKPADEGGGDGGLPGFETTILLVAIVAAAFVGVGNRKKITNK